MEKEQHTIRHGERDGVITSGAHITYWLDSAPLLRYQPLREDLRTEVAIVGGGIAGLSVAYCLAKAGKKVIVVDDGFIGSGETGRTTAHLVNALDDRYSEIERLLGAEKCRLAAESHTEAINFIENVVQQENIDCDFRRLDGYLFLHPTDNMGTIEEEYHATNRNGIRTEKMESVPGIAAEQGPCLLFPRQAQFHPMTYLKGLCDSILRMGGLIFTETHVERIDKTGIRSRDHEIRADFIVVATNTPVNDLVTMHTKQHPYRTYVIGGLVDKNSITPALWWDTGDARSEWVTDPYHYVRLQSFDDDHDLLLAGGEDHKTGQADKENIGEAARYARLEDWVRQRFPAMKEIVYRWSGQVMEPVDKLGFIGRNPGDQNIFISTGDSGNGMTHGTIAGMLISDLVTGKENPWASLYAPSRITIKAAGDFLKEAGNMGMQYLDYFERGDIASVAELKPGQGAIFSLEGKKAAAYRDESAKLHVFSAICPHLGCVVQWNDDERSFDCPCHGSRFTCHGNVVNGPANKGLEPMNI